MDRTIYEIKAEKFYALAHPLRLKIVDTLGGGACCVCKIIPSVGVEQSNVSHHLAILRKAGIVKSEKRGLEVWYSVTDPQILQITEMMHKFVVGSLRRSERLLRSMGHK